MGAVGILTVLLIVSLVAAGVMTFMWMRATKDASPAGGGSTFLFLADGGGVKLGYGVFDSKSISTVVQ